MTPMIRLNININNNIIIDTAHMANADSVWRRLPYEAVDIFIFLAQTTPWPHAQAAIITINQLTWPSTTAASTSARRLPLLLPYIRWLRWRWRKVSEISGTDGTCL